MSPEGGGGWTFLRVVGVIVGLLGMVGFGLCSLCGFFFGLEDMGIFLLALLGAGIAVLFGWMVTVIARAARRDRDSGQ
jgi:hypothetical protein